ncbi:MAG TPA: RluA family pseudouridine synthase [Terriglobales bacterium]
MALLPDAMTERPTFVCESGDEPRLDRFLNEQLPELSRTKLQALIRAGAVLVDGVAAARPSLRLASGARIELVELAAAPPSGSAPQPEAIPLDILYEDDDLAAINKPAGLVVHAGAGHRSGTLVNALLHRYGTLSSGGGGAAERPGIVHRLDQYTSGVMLVARNDAAHQKLSEQFQQRSLRKIYRALVQGTMAESVGEIELPIHRDLHHRLRMTTRRRDGRAARTGYRVLETLGSGGSRYSWLEIELHTGRTHQIRVHLGAVGHPVVGDRLYGAAAALAGPGALAGFRAPRPMLHAASIAFTHPRTGAPLQFSAPLPSDITSLLEILRSS